MTSKVDAVVLAGGQNSRAMREMTGVEVRALTPLGERTMLDHVMAALGDANAIDQIVLVGNVPAFSGAISVAPRVSLVENVFAGLAALDSARPVLVVTSDIPFLTPAAIDDFVARALPTGADFCYPIVPLACCAARFPQMRRTSLRLREGVFTGGNVMLIQPQVALGQRETITRAYAARKSPLALGRMLGGGLLAKLFVSLIFPAYTLSVSELEAGVSRLLGSRAAAVATEYAEIGTDVDKPSDVAAARDFFAEMANGKPSRR